jgi:TatD DNase family protein
MIIDTHSHLNFKAYKNDLEEVVKRMQDNNIWAINVGTKYETSKEAIEVAERFGEGLFAAVGLHPIHIKTDLLKLRTDEDEGGFAPLGEEFDKEKYKDLAKSKKVVAIGEIGLDYYYKPKTKTRLEQFKEKQKEVFVQQLDMAEELNLPVIIHCRMAHQDLINILKQKNQIKGVIHCFTGTLEEAKEYIKLGFYIGINGIIFKFNIDEVIKNISIENILVETDCPYLTPIAEGKDKRNEPIFVKHVIQKIADLKEISFDEVVAKTTGNAKKLFGI